MKASAFSYARATSVVNALELLAAHGDDAKVLSGGQSLMPAMNLRLISPELIVDIGGLAELKGIAVRDNVLTIGALTRHVDLQRSPEIATLAPFEADGLVRRTPTGLEVTDSGRLFIRNIAMCFDNTLAPSGERKHSKTI